MAAVKSGNDTHAADDIDMVCFPYRLTLPGAVHELLSNEADLSSRHCCQPNGRPCGATFAVFSEVPVVDRFCEEKLPSAPIDRKYDIELIRVWLRIVQAAVIFGGSKGFL